jgi:KTSC domain
MNRQPTPQSSQIESAGHSADDPDWDGAEDTLEVRFKGGGAVWQYHPVSLRRFNAMMEAESVGKAFNRIKQDPDVKAKKVSDGR